MRRLILSVLTIAFSFAVVNVQATTILTSSNTTRPSYSQIDLIAFDMNAILDTDFTIERIAPYWIFTAHRDRLNPGNVLTFYFHFLTNPAPNYFPLWTDKKNPFGVEGGTDGPSDLRASDWSTPIPEPATLLLFGTGLIGLARFGKRN